VVSTPDGTRVGAATSGPDGVFRVAVPGPATYRVALDVTTLPTGVRLRDPSRRVLEAVAVQEGQQKFVVFPLGAPAAGTAVPRPSEWRRLVNLAASGLRFGLIIGLCALGLTLVYGTTGLVNFAHGELITFGAIVAWYLNTWGLPLATAAVLAAVAGALLGAGLEREVWRPLRRRRTGTVALMVVSIGIALAARNVYLVIFGGNPRSYRQYAVQAPWELGPLQITPKNAAAILISLGVLTAVAWWLERSRTGTAVRAVSDDPELAEASGIDTQRVLTVVWVLGTGLAAFGGVLLGLTQSVQWDVGLRLLLLTFAAVVVGGLGSPAGAMAGGLVIGFASELSTFWIATDFKDVVALLALIVVLLVRPQGILGLRERVA
jgi:branched-chain amino acid transport system permease protein